MQKIVFVLGNYKNGGMANRATNLANEFACNGFEVDILVTGGMSEERFVPINPNVRIVDLRRYNEALLPAMHHITERTARDRKIRRYKRIRMLTKRLPGLDRRLADKISFLRGGADLLDYVLNTGPDIMIPLGVPYLEPVVSACAEVKCRVYYAEKNAPELEFPAPGTDEFQRYSSLLKRTDGIIVQTQSAKRFFENSFDTIFVINNPVKQNLPTPHSGARRKSIVNFCRLSPQKNLDLLIDAFALLHKDYSDYCLEIYGNTVGKTEEMYKIKIAEKVGALKLNDCVSVLPPAADVHEKIIDSAMFVSSSDYEGLSNSMIEAMAIGLPCICTDCLGGGTREVMRDKENGLIVPVKDPQALYEAMKCYIENPGFAEQCGKNASAVRSRLDAKEIARQWIAAMSR